MLAVGAGAVLIGAALVYSMWSSKDEDDDKGNAGNDDEYDDDDYEIPDV